MFDYKDFKENITLIEKSVSNKLVIELKYKKIVDRVIIPFGLITIISCIYVTIMSFINAKDDCFTAVLIITMLPTFVLAIMKKDYDGKVEVLEYSLARINKAHSDLEMINKILIEKKPYIFYLRDFKGSRSEITKNTTPGSSPAASTIEHGKESTRMAIEFFSNKYPVLLLNSKNDKTLFMAGYIIYPNNTQWFRVFELLLSSSTFIIIDYNFSRLTENIKKEIISLIKLQRKKIFFIGTQKDIRNMKRKFPDLAQLITEYFIATTSSTEDTDIDFSKYDIVP